MDIKKSKAVTICAVVAILAVNMHADTVYWGGSDGNWSVGSNWSGGVLPTSIDTVLIGNNPGDNIIIIDTNANADVIYTGQTYSSTIQINSSSASLTTARSFYVGNSSSDSVTSTFTQNDGTVTVNSNMGVGGSGTTSSGYYYMNGGTLSVGATGTSTNIGSSSGTHGYFIQTGGTAAFGGDYFNLGAAGAGAYTISSGTLEINSTYFSLGNQSGGSGTFTVIGGNADITINKLAGFGTYVTDKNLVFEFNGSGISTIDITQSANLTDTTITVTNGGGVAEGTYNILHYGTTITTTDLTVNVPDGWSWGIDTTNQNVWVTAIPEPTSLCLLIGGMGSFLILRKRTLKR